MLRNILQFLNESSDSDFINFLIDKKLIANEVICLYCRTRMAMKKTKDNRLGVVWKCNNYQCIHYQTTKSILKNSFFDGFKLGPRKILKIIYYLSKSQLDAHIIDFVGSNDIIIRKIKFKLYEIINEYYIINQPRIGGLDRVVQIDETKLNYNVKSHRGRSPRDPVWAVTIVDTTSTPSKGYAEIVRNRSSETLNELINRVVIPGSIIHTDEWRGYNFLINSNDYRHSTVCHKYNFVNSITGTHIQNAESFNNKIKYEIKKRKGIKDEKKADFLNFFIFLDTHKNNAFIEILNLLKRF